MKRSVFAVVALLTILSAPASQVVFPPLTKETIVGTWEALVGDKGPLHIMLLAHIEISADGPSYFAYQILGKPSDAINLLPMISCDITDQQITLRFRGEEPGGGSAEWFFVGSGTGIVEDGEMSGYLDMGAPPAATDKKNAYFLKSSWTRGIANASQKAEEAITKARENGK